jgi:hypothetical protein
VAALPDRFLGHGKPQDILAENGLDADGLAGVARDAVRAMTQRPAG